MKRKTKQIIGETISIVGGCMGLGVLFALADAVVAATDEQLTGKNHNYDPIRAAQNDTPLQDAVDKWMSKDD